ncbi:CIA30 family protein [Aquimarina sp. Aq107]|uniref:CIA30 family protein n=1 Tax=Aquimarina sp. Aq107 TaxID=1191912 RepID=UPI001F4865BD|nr:CIA30 family protein [Aquimarina sp. Aq107]
MINHITSYIFTLLMTYPLVIFDFNKNSNLSNWTIVNDVVMGGVSNSSLEINPDGNAVFSGTVSLENNGGFSLVRYRFETLKVRGYTKAIIKLKGDPTTYQFRAKTNYNDRYSYIAIFKTTGEWQTIEISLSEMYPAFRGRKLDLPNYQAEQMQEIAFLIGNKKEEKFELIIDTIELK